MIVSDDIDERNKIATIHCINIPLELEMERIHLHQRGSLIWKLEDKMALAATCKSSTTISFRLTE